MSARVLIFAKKENGAAQDKSTELQNFLTSLKVDVLSIPPGEARITESEVKDIALGVVIGGDGTFLTLVKRLEKKDAFPIMGFNLGTVGFITEFGAEHMLDSVRAALDGKYEEQSRPLLKVELLRDGKVHQSGMVFNDVVINKDTRTSLSIMDISANDTPLSHVRADGYIVATATGSTGYAMSAGGPLLHPAVGGVVLVPICPHALSARPIILPEDLKVEIEVHRFGGTAYLVYDGQINVEMKEGDRVRITKADSLLRIVRSPSQGWADALQAKLQMG